jgi:23S rRNA pseudouridine2604 synthase
MERYGDLTDAEIKELNALIEPSSKTEEASFQKEEEKRELLIIVFYVFLL